MNYDHLVVEREDQIATLTLNRPERKNALNKATREDLRQFLAQEASDVKVAVITGAGDSFCSGMDLNEPIGHGEGRDQWSLFKQLFNSPIIFIAAVNGPCAGAGQTIVSACDLAFADPSARFSLPQITHGFYGGVAAAMLHLSLPKKVIAEMTLTGQPLSVERAREVGFINAVSEPGEAFNDALSMARRIAGFEGRALGIAKEVIQNLPDNDADREAAVREVKIATLNNMPKQPDRVPDTRHRTKE